MKKPGKTTEQKPTDSLLTDLCSDWLKRIEMSRASESRKGFMTTASMCHQFYSGAFGLMWSPDFRNKHLGDIPSPRFKITIAKPFELVAVMGPSLFWDYPGRVIKSLPVMELPMEAFGQGEMAQERHDMYMQDLQNEIGMQDARNALMERYLNWAQREQIGGGLTYESQLAIVEALVKGRGVMFTDTYKHPASDDKILTRSRFTSVDDVYLDPECKRNNLSDCYWVAIKRRTPYWELERRFNLPKNSLRDKATKESLQASGLNKDTSGGGGKAKALTNDAGDLVEWYEIFSKEGIGNRNKRHRSQVEENLEGILGDYAYLAIAKGIDYPLNLSPKKFKGMQDEEALREALEWPTPYWKDGKWPISFLDFYPQPNSPWPLAPLAMGLGELVLLNVIISCVADRVYESCRSLGLVGDSLGTDVINKLKNFDFSGWHEVPANLVKDVKDMISYIQTPQIDNNVWNLIELVSDMFDKRTGLMPRLYGSPSGQPRSATESEAQQSASNVRQEWMARKTEEWQTDIANAERICAGWHVEGSSLVELLGRTGAEMWDSFIAEEDPEVFMLQMRATLEANSIKKPNKNKDFNNLTQATGYVMPVLSQYFQATGDPGPLNGFLGDLAESMDHHGNSWELPEVETPQASPEEEQMQQMEQQKAQVEAATAEANLEGKQLQNEKLKSESLPLMDPEQAMFGGAEEPPPEEIPVDPFAPPMEGAYL